MSDLLWDQKLKIASLRQAMLKALRQSGETDISIIIAALSEMIATASDWNLEAERKHMQEGRHTTIVDADV